MKKITAILCVVIVFIIVFFVIRYSNNNPYEKRIEWTIISLHAIRYDISAFYEENGKYPESLLEIKELAQNETNSRFSYSKREYKEHLSCQEGNTSEFQELNNKGGWFYNAENGKVKINLTEPLHIYFESYYYSNRNEIPSEW